MKSIIVLLLALLSFSTFAECNREAQFMGTVTNLKYSPAREGSPEHFTFQVKIGRWFAPSIVCPMWEDELETAVIELEGFPRIIDGYEISGIMVFDYKTNRYRID